MIILDMRSKIPASAMDVDGDTDVELVLYNSYSRHSSYSRYAATSPLRTSPPMASTAKTGKIYPRLKFEISNGAQKMSEYGTEAEN